MSIVPQNVFERIFNVIVITFAMVVFSSFVSSITNAMTHIRNTNQQTSQRDTILRQYFLENRVPHALKCRVWKFLRRNPQRKRQRALEKEVLNNLPLHFRDCLDTARFLFVMM